MPRRQRPRAVDAGIAVARQRARVLRVRPRARYGRSLPRVRFRARAAFERLAHDVGVRGKSRFAALRVPPLDELAPLVAETSAAWTQPAALTAHGWEELGIRLAAAAARCAADPTRVPRNPRNAESGIARAVRLIERDPRAPLPLSVLAREARLSRFHFVRAFARVTGLTPHRYLRRARLRQAAARLASSDARVIDIALDCGFRDVSNFNHAFRAELGAAPLEWRARLGRGLAGSHSRTLLPMAHRLPRRL